MPTGLVTRGLFMHDTTEPLPPNPPTSENDQSMTAVAFNHTRMSTKEVVSSAEYGKRRIRRAWLHSR